MTAEQLEEYARIIKNVYTDEGSDKMGCNPHDYSSTYAKLFSTIADTHSAKVAEIGIYHGSSIRAMVRLLPGAAVYGIDIEPVSVDGAITVSGDGYNSKTWELLPKDFDIVIDDGSNNIVDMVRGFAVLMGHIRLGGYLLIEDISNMRDVSTLLNNFSGGTLIDTRKHGIDNDLSVVWQKRNG